MIVRLMGEGQFEVDDDCAARLNELDDKALAALDSTDEPELDRLLEDMAALVRAEGRELAADDLSPSEAIIPPSDLTLDEMRDLMSDDGLIPDLPPA